MVAPEWGVQRFSTRTVPESKVLPIAPMGSPPSAAQTTPWPRPRQSRGLWPEARWSEGAAPPSRPCRTGTAAPELKHSDDRPHAPWFASATQGLSVYPQPQPSGIPAAPFSRSPYHTIADVAAVTSFVPRWIEQLLARYNAHGPEALGDLRRRNGSAPSVLRPELLARLPERLATPPSDGGLWTGPKVAAWMAGELGLAAVLPQRGWEALKAINWSVQKPRPRHPAAATPEECETFKKSWPRW